MNDQVQANNDPVTEWVTFRLDAEKYGVDVMRVREVLRDIEITPVPGAPNFILGIINLRGNVVTVIDTRKRFGLGSKDVDDLSRIVVLESGSEVVGMLVDSVAEVADVHTSAIEFAPNVGNDESSKFIQGVSNREDGLLILVDVNSLLGSVGSG